MPMEDQDIWRAANEMIKLHGRDAELQAAKRVDHCFNLGDAKGASTWKRVATAIRDQRRYKDGGIGPKL
jgi:hypothetical protein